MTKACTVVHYLQSMQRFMVALRFNFAYCTELLTTSRVRVESNKHLYGCGLQLLGTMGRAWVEHGKQEHRKTAPHERDSRVET